MTDQAPPETSPGTPLNYIVIVSDTLRRDHLSCYGNDWIHTEHLQRFADKSLVFDKAYSASFPTVPCRRDIFTGNYTCTYTPWAPLHEMEPVVQALLGPAYTTMMIVDQHHILENGFHYDRGFDGFIWIRGQEGDRWLTDPRAPEFRCDPTKLRNPDRLQRCHMRGRAHRCQEADTFPGRTGTAVCNWLERNYDQGPFYLYVDFFDPHEPWDAPQWYVDMYDPGYEGEIVDYPRYDKWKDFLSPEELKHTQALYAAEVTLIDRWVGRILEKAEDLGLFDNTVIIFTTDHGFLLGEHEFIGKSSIKRSADGNQDILAYLPLFEEINHVPFIVHHPAGITGRTDAIVQHPDIFATILASAGKPTLGAHGRSFEPVLLGQTPTHREFAASFPYLRGAGKPISFVKDDYAAVFFSRATDAAGAKPAGAPAQDDGKVDKAVDGVEKIQRTWEDARDMLFNLREDPGQEHDVSGADPERLARYRQLLLDFLEDLGTEDDIIQQFQR